jgi:hypothetical protein
MIRTPTQKTEKIYASVTEVSLGSKISRLEIDLGLYKMKEIETFLLFTGHVYRVHAMTYSSR